jgi:hypothetical protein
MKEFEFPSKQREEWLTRGLFIVTDHFH